MLNLPIDKSKKFQKLEYIVLLIFGVIIMKKFSLVELTKKLYDKLNEKDFKERTRMRKQDFTRKGKMGFVNTMLFILHGPKRSLQVALNSFFKEMNMQKETYSKQAFSEGRRRIKPEAFREIFDDTVEFFYSNASYETYKGYRVTAIDGTKYNLPNTDELLGIYGMQPSTNQVQALGSCLYDVLNGILIDVSLNKYNANERELAKEHIDKLSEIKTNKELVLMDRGYPSANLIEFLEKKNVNYIMRTSPMFIKKINTTGNDCIVEHKFQSCKITFKMRIIRVEIAPGIEEILISNIYGEDFTIDDFKKLYHMRWNIEEKYDDLKNKLEIENFSGTNIIAIQQDFYATMFLSNLASMIAYNNKDEIKKHHNNNPNNKLRYKQNISITIATLKDNVIELLITDSRIKRARLLGYINRQLLHSVIPIKDGRHYNRVRRHLSQKFPNNRKRL